MEHLQINIRGEDDGAKYKCGEVFMKSCENSLIFICTCCDESFKDLDTFTEHLFEELEKNKKEARNDDQGDDYNSDKMADLDNTITAEGVYNSEEEGDNGNNLLAPMHAVFLREPPEDDSEPETTKRSVRVANKKKKTSTTKASPNSPKSSKNTISLPRKVYKPTTYKCNVCEKVFRNKYSLRLHSYIHAEVKPFPCDLCTMRFANRTNLAVHRRRHTGETPYHCKFCPRAFKASTECKIHMRFHTGDRPYVCEDCGKGYTTSGKLTYHRRSTHLGQRDFKCELCSKAFTVDYRLRAHIRLVHSNPPRDKECDTCGSTFKSTKTLNEHKKIHKDKNYICAVCGKAFAQKPGLYSHMKSHDIATGKRTPLDK